VQTLPGFEKAIIQRFAYAVEYDAVDPLELTPGLQSRKLPGLFTAGQLNGTSGYEEAAAQGLLAGLNAARYAMGLTEVCLPRESGYIGVMVDDLVHRGVDEPYRMMTSRVELRLLCRADNADERLVPLAAAWGLRPMADLQAVRAKYARVEGELLRLQKSRLDGVSALQYLRRPEASYEQMLQVIGQPEVPLAKAEAYQVEVRAKYAGYMERQARLREKLKELETYLLPSTLDYAQVPSLSKEAAEKLGRIRPHSVAEASRVPGIRDSDLTALLVYITKMPAPA
jgi:tRNA uridine 5-carboxymethylaminomethyl modification enzyme